MAEDSTVSASAKGATFLILLQIGSRALTFGLNQILLRFLSPGLLGAAVQLELYIISAHHFARESLRVACQRQSGKDGIQAAINLSYLAVLGGIPIVLILAQGYLQTGYPDVPFFVESLRICEMAAVIELFAEPAFVAVQQNLLYKTRAAAEASAVVMKTITTASIVFYGQYKNFEVGVIPFAAGELAYCATLTLVYIWRTTPVATGKGFSLLLQPIQPRPGQEYYFSYFSTSLIYLSVSLYIQSGLKYLLTQGDTIVSTTLASLEDQGLYALSANYGGLIARMIFRPIEDSSRNMFAKLCGTLDSSTSTTTNKGETKPQRNPSNDTQQAATVLRDILRFYSVVSLIAFSVGPSAAPLLLRVVAGSRWAESGAGEVLSLYCYCIPLLAINGVSEAFVAAAASTRELHQQSIWMGVFSVGFALSSYLFLRVLNFGAAGLVLANCVNMLLRIIFNLNFVARYFKQKNLDFALTAILPSPYATALSAAVPSILSRTQGLAIINRYGLLGELVRVGGIGAAFALTVAFLERRFLMGVVRNFRS